MLMGPRKSLAAILLLTVATVLGGIRCATDLAGLDKHVIITGGITRVYWLHSPSRAPESSLPLLLVLHRFAETGPAMAHMTQFNSIADREGFLVAYPDGLFRTWNGLGTAIDDDVAFLRNVVADVSRNHNVDPHRVFITGASSGGYMALRAAVEAPGLFAAAAAVMATMPRSIADADADLNPLPVLFMHGTEDPIVPYEADVVYAGPGRRFAVFSVPQAVAYWVSRNGCDPAPVAEQLPDADPHDGTTTFRETYGNGVDGADVVLYRIEGGGHTWPGGCEPWPAVIVGKVSRDFQASEAVWTFFETHARAT